MRQERPGCETAQERAHLFQRRLRGWIASKVMPLFRVVAEVEQLLASVALSADVRPLSFLYGSQWREFFGHTPGIAVERVVRNQLGERRKTRWRHLRRGRRGLFPEASQ